MLACDGVDGQLPNSQHITKSNLIPKKKETHNNKRRGKMIQKRKTEQNKTKQKNMKHQKRKRRRRRREGGGGGGGGRGETAVFNQRTRHGTPSISLIRRPNKPRLSFSLQLHEFVMITPAGSFFPLTTHNGPQRNEGPRAFLFLFFFYKQKLINR